uniref:Uncharacterized protein n=1 Tax=Clastoptera arizonana TaxID=38151 RepID=A0A1B6EFW8_9HEMI
MAVNRICLHLLLLCFLRFVLCLERTNFYYRNFTWNKRNVKLFYPSNQNPNTILFRNKTMIFDLLDRKKAKSPIKVTKTLRAFNDCFKYKDLTFPSMGRKPVIVIEGNSKDFSMKVAEMLATEMDAEILSTPQECMVDAVKINSDDPLLREAALGLAMYATMHKVRHTLYFDRTVILNGYWTEKIADKIEYKFRWTSILPYMSSAYKLPYDLMKPDIIFYLNFGDFPNKRVEIYERILFSRIVIINMDLDLRKSLLEIKYILQNRLGGKFLLSP